MPGGKNNRKSGRQPTVFIDRDGVINHNRTEHVLCWEDFKFEDGAIEGLRLLNLHGFKVVVITNQAAIERGLTTEEQVNRLHRQMSQEIEYHGGQIHEVYYCPHRPEVKCHCRKPAPGLLYQAAARLELELSTSWLVGDYVTDIEAGLAAGCKSILVLTGRGQLSLNTLKENPAMRQVPIKRNLLEAVEFIIHSEQATYDPTV